MELTFATSWWNFRPQNIHVFQAYPLKIHGWKINFPLNGLFIGDMLYDFGRGM